MLHNKCVCHNCVVTQVEESVVAGKLLLASMRRLRPAWAYELKDLLDMEMVGGAVLPGCEGACSACV